MIAALCNQTLIAPQYPWRSLQSNSIWDVARKLFASLPQSWTGFSHG
jgi:hypothetical protein